MKHRTFTALSFLLVIALMAISFSGCDKRTFEPDSFEIINLTAPDVLYSEFEGTIEALVVTKKDGVPAPEQTVTFKTDIGIIGAKGLTDEFGIARVTFYHNVTDTLHATVEASIQRSKMQRIIEVVPFEGDFGITRLTATPSTIYADNNATVSTIQATVKDKSGIGVSEKTVKFKCDLGKITILAVTDEFGIATAEFGDDGDEGEATITAMIDQSIRTVKVMIEPAVAGYNITLTATPTTIYSDNNVTYSRIRARVTDGEGFPAIEELVRFKTDLGVMAAQAYTDSMGVATANFFDSGDIGFATIRAFVGSVSNSVNVTIDPVPLVESIEITNELEDLSIETEMTIQAVAYNELGEPVSDGTMVAFTATKGFFTENNLSYIIGTTTNGIASVGYDTGTTAGALTITASIGDATHSKHGTIKPGLPASITLRPQILDSLGVWVDMPPEGIPVNYDGDVRIRASVRDLYNNPVPFVALQFETDLGGIQPFAITDEAGMCHASYFPGTSAGTAQIIATTLQMGEDGEPVTGMTIITIYSDEVNSIVFTVAEEIFLDVIGVGGVTSRPLRVELRDFGGNLVSGQHMVRYEIVGNNPPTGVNINNVGMSVDILANNGTAIASINSGTGSGTVKVKVTLLIDGQPTNITSTKSNIVIRSGPPHTVQPSISNFDMGESMGNGVWRIEAGAMVKDIHNNPVIDGTAVWFSIGTSPQPPPNCYIDGAGFTGNPLPGNEDGNPGYAGTFLYYHGEHTFDKVTIQAESGEVIGSHLITLPIQQPRMEVQVSPAYVEYFPNSTHTSALSEIHVSLIDGQGNDISGGKILITATHGKFEYYQWFDDFGNPINDPYTHPQPGQPPVPYYINTYQNLAKGYIRTFMYECPEPEDDYSTQIDVQINAFLQGTNTIAQTSMTIRRYRDNP